MKQLSLAQLGDQELLLRVSATARHCREGEVTLVYDLAEIDRRRLYLRHGATSLFDFCTRRLHLSESSAYKRITVARAVGHFAQLAEALRTGRLHLAGAVVLMPVLNVNNIDRWLATAAFKSRREIEALVAAERALHGEVVAPKAASLKAMPVAAGIPFLADTKPGKEKQTPGLLGGTHRAKIGALPDAGHEGTVAARPTAVAAAAAAAAAAPAATAWPAAAATDIQEASAAAADAKNYEEGGNLPEGSHGVPRCSTGYCRLAVSLDTASSAALQEVRALMAHQVPSGDLNVIIGVMLQRMARALKEQKFGLKKTKPKPQAKPADRAQTQQSAKTAIRRPLTPIPPFLNPRPPSWADKNSVSQQRSYEESKTEHGDGLGQRSASPNIPVRGIPRPVRREVFLRDAGKCTYFLPDGRRCETTRQLEYHHITPFAHCEAHAVDNITLHCRAHNALAAEKDFGAGLMQRYHRGGGPRKMAVPCPATMKAAGRPPARQAARQMPGI